MIYLFTAKERERIPGVLYEGVHSSRKDLPCLSSSWLFQEPSAPHLGLQIGSLTACGDLRRHPVGTRHNSVLFALASSEGEVADTEPRSCNLPR